MTTIDRLDNGIKIVLEKMVSVRSVTVGIWVKSGSIYENKSNNGISHFIEHMIFKGTANRTARQIAEHMSAIGGHINAFTAKEYTCFYAQILDEHLNIALDVLSDMVQNSLFANGEMKKEKVVILDEIDMYEDSPEELVHDQFQQNVWSDHAIGYNILGTKENIDNIAQQDLLTYFQENYTVDNIIISVAGNFEVDSVKYTLNKIFNNINKSTTKNIQENNTVNYTKSFIYKDKDIEQVHLCLGYPGINYHSDEIYILAIMNTILGGSMNSRLFQAIREEKGLAYSIYSYTTTYEQAGLINIYAATNPMYVNDVVSQVNDEIKKLKDNSITIDELINTKEQLKSNYIIGLESTNSRMSNNGKSVLLLNRIKTQEEIINKINAVSLEKFTDFTRNILEQDKVTLSIVGRLDNIDMKKVEEYWKN